MDPSCGKAGGKAAGKAAGVDLEKVPADHAKAERVRGFAEFVDRRVGALLEAAGAAGLTARQLVKGVNGQGTVYGEVTINHIKASLDSMEVTYQGDRVWLTKFFKAEHSAEAPLSFTPWAQFAFCPTGPGGGVDPTCSPKGGGGGKGKGKGRAAPAEAGVGPSGRPLFRDRTREAVDAALAAGKSLPNTLGNPYDPAGPAGAGMHKVYLADLYDAVGAGLGMSLDEFKRRLLEAHLAGQVQLLRDDIGNTLSAENAAKSARSEVTHLGATFHALNVAWRPPAEFAAEAPLSFTPWAQFAFCPTGPGGGVDPTCSPKGGGGASASGRPASRREALQVLRAAKQAAKQAHDLSYQLPREMDREQAWRLRGLAAAVTFEYHQGPDKAHLPAAQRKKTFADRAADARRLRDAALGLAREYANAEIDRAAGESHDLDTIRQLRQIAALALRAEKAFARLATPKAGGAAAQFAAEAPLSFTPWAQGGAA